MVFQVKVLKENAAPFSTSTPSLRRSVSKSQEQPVASGPPAPVSETPDSGTNANENGANKELEGEQFVTINYYYALVMLIIL